MNKKRVWVRELARILYSWNNYDKCKGKKNYNEEMFLSFYSYIHYNLVLFFILYIRKMTLVKSSLTMNTQ